MKGKKRQIQEILESFHLPGNRSRVDSGRTKIFMYQTAPACRQAGCYYDASVQPAQRSEATKGRTLVLQQF